MFPLPVLLEGPVGSGKTTIFLELAKELGLRYFANVLSDQTSASEFKGYKNVMNGEYVSNEFRDAFEFGGLYVLEEINAATSNMPIIFNTIENGFFTFADKVVYAHKDFRLGATMNSITNAKDFGGRRPLDKSVKNRFHIMMIEGDLTSRFDVRSLQIKEAIDDHLDSQGVTDKVTPRDISRYKQLMENGMSETIAIKKTMMMGYLITDKKLTELLENLGEWKL